LEVIVIPIVVLVAALGIPTQARHPTTNHTDPVRYYFTLFGGESEPFRPRTAHTWGVYVKATPTIDGGHMYEVITISWLPANARVQPLRIRPVQGKNWTLDETFAIMGSNKARVSHWGPYEIDAYRFDLAQQQAAFLESGIVWYRSIDSFNLNNYVVNCVHALTHAGPNARYFIQPVIRVGEPGTSRLAKLYVRDGAFIGYPQTHEDIFLEIGGDHYPSVKRQPGERIPRHLR
jgi:hypothetical protein